MNHRPADVPHGHPGVTFLRRVRAGTRWDPRGYFGGCNGTQPPAVVFRPPTTDRCRLDEAQVGVTGDVATNRRTARRSADGVAAAPRPRSELARPSRRTVVPCRTEDLLSTPEVLAAEAPPLHRADTEACGCARFTSGGESRLPAARAALGAPRWRSHLRESPRANAREHRRRPGDRRPRADSLQGAPARDGVLGALRVVGRTHSATSSIRCNLSPREHYRRITRWATSAAGGKYARPWTRGGSRLRTAAGFQTMLPDGAPVRDYLGHQPSSPRRDGAHRHSPFRLGYQSQGAPNGGSLTARTRKGTNRRWSVRSPRQPSYRTAERRRRRHNIPLLRQPGNATQPGNHPMSRTSEQCRRRSRCCRSTQRRPSARRSSPVLPDRSRAVDTRGTRRDSAAAFPPPRKPGSPRSLAPAPTRRSPLRLQSASARSGGRWCSPADLHVRRSSK